MKTIGAYLVFLFLLGTSSCGQITAKGGTVLSGGTQTSSLPQNFLAFGDSVTQGFDATNPLTQGYASVTAHHFNSSVDNRAMSGTRIGAWPFWEYFGVPTTTTTAVSIFGIGDAVAINSNSTLLAAWKLVAQA